MTRAALIRRGLGLAALFVALSGQAQAQAFVNPLCRSYVSPADLRFDTAEHARWYKRFWTGECDHLLACLPGKPNWNDIAAQLVAHGGAVERLALQPKVCTLGQRIGLEWSREHKVRRVSTADLHRYYDMLRRDGDPLHGVEAVARAVDGDLRRPPPR
ncbi:hypothetical protein LJR225_002000 [Phenylobacterium sp. LjRoot225]|uniref:hypothetical protein n=1 Tax=Phenylobacterium sp. LjRoot225 TaxID=3342285 RepID=UPI003ECCCCF8